MITYNDLTEEMRQTIIDSVRDGLLRLGINVEDVNLASKIIYDGREMVSVKTSTFNTTPVIYKAIKVKGYGFIEESERKDGTFLLPLALCYDFTYFNGANNGVDIGEMSFFINQERHHVTCLGLTLKR